MAEGLRRRGHSVQLVRPRQNGHDRPVVGPGFEEKLARGIPSPRYMQFRMGLPARGALLRAWSARRPNIVHIATEGPLGWSALSAAKKLGFPVTTMVSTAELAGELEQAGYRGLRVVGRGVNPQVFSPARRSRELRARWGAGEDAPVALCVSPLCARRRSVAQRCAREAGVRKKKRPTIARSGRQAPASTRRGNRAAAARSCGSASGTPHAGRRI